MDRLPFPSSGSAGSTPAAACPSRDKLGPPDDFLEIKRSEELYRVLFESAPDAMLLTDQEGRILEVNAQAERQFGYRREDLVGGSVDKLIPQRFRDVHGHLRRIYQVAPEYGPMNRGDALFALRKDGSEFPVDISPSPVLTEEGTLFYCIVRDTSERVAARQLERHLKFEQALAGLSAKFINLPANLVDQEITHGLQVLTEALDCDRATLGQLDLSTGDIVATHAWARPGIPYLDTRALKEALPWLYAHVMGGGHVAVEKPDDLPPEACHEREYMESIGMKSAVDVPFRVGGKVIGGVAVDSFGSYQQWDDAIVSRIQDIADIFANALSRKRADEELRKAYAEIQELEKQLEQENVYLREEIKLGHNHTAVIGNSAAIRSVLKKAEQVAGTDSAVLILGETGTGKELIARTIHEISRRKHHPMIKINCAALPATLIESELFGREKGAYTGALAREIGRFELADKSTIFLDEIGELPQELQAKLLRVLQEGEFERLGSPKTMRVDVRVIAATSRNLQAMVKEGTFREDLFYRLDVFPIFIPPLRERREDIPALVWHILRNLGKRMGRNVEALHASTMREFQKHSWPGNVRELGNVIERNLILNTGPIFRAEVPDLGLDKDRSLRRLDEVEMEHLRTVLQSTHWRVRGRGGAAEVLGLKPTTLEARLKKLGIRRPP